jgi:hypothetical protein
MHLEGFDELQRKLQELASRAEKLDGDHSVPMSELFPPDFMRRFTDFPDIDEMFEASGFRIESTEDFAKVPDDAWDTFVAERTLFASWHEMQEKAAGEWAAKKLGFDE